MNIDHAVLESSLPENFAFYHLGTIQKQGEKNKAPAGENTWDDLQIIAYPLKGDLDAVFLIAIEKGLDPSIYSEAGNIMASQLVTALDREGIDVLLSPPQVIEDERFVKLSENWRTIVEKDYLHLHGNNAVWVRSRIVRSL
jgi:hypothetical protein